MKINSNYYKDLSDNLKCRRIIKAKPDTEHFDFYGLDISRYALNQIQFNKSYTNKH